MSKIEPDLALPQILSRLMADKGLKERDVVTATGLTQYNISNILRGRSKNPSLLTLKVLAKLFGITIGQLVGHESLETDLPPITSRSSLKIIEDKPPSLAPLTIPIIQWSEVRVWLSGQRGIKAHSVWVVNDICKSPKAFALKVKPSMRSQFFSADATLLVDPSASIGDGLIILIFLNPSSKEPVLRLLTVDGEEKWLNLLEESPLRKSPVILSPEHLVVGPIVEVRYAPGIR